MTWVDAATKAPLTNQEVAVRFVDAFGIAMISIAAVFVVYFVVALTWEITSDWWWARRRR